LDEAVSVPLDKNETGMAPEKVASVRESVRTFLKFDASAVKFDLEHRFTECLLEYYKESVFYFDGGAIVMAILIGTFDLVRTYSRSSLDILRIIGSSTIIVLSVAWGVWLHKLRRNSMSVFYSTFPSALYCTYGLILAYFSFIYAFVDPFV